MNIVRAQAAKKKILSLCGGKVKYCELILGDKGFRIEVHPQDDVVLDLPSEMDSIPILVRYT